MAKTQEEEAKPLLPLSPTPIEAEKVPAAPVASSEKVPERTTSPVGKLAGEGEWTAEGLPIGHISVVGQPVRKQWSSGLFSCLGRCDEFYSSDLEVCVLGSAFPCVLYGSNAERLSSEPAESFLNNCKIYTTLYVLGNILFGWNCIAPWLAHTTRTTIRRKYNLQGNFESFAQSTGCLSSLANNAERLEQLEVACDLATHYLCHTCALCQEGREIRRQVPHPGFFAARPVYAMVPPSEQTMGHGAST
ncbi:Cell number regulator 8 [Rhynchospora pubera]|uniref:Cell number regulator 8 n=1 Tax=Rhynchospora pubera TaxID=906938 RepID=A0AAV8GWU3_9POAL|nr:Cell number regulator 8 [Rhynchospora pubera]